MDSTESRLKIYLKAGLDKETVLEKMEEHLTDANREKILGIIETHFSDKQANLIVKAMVLGTIALIVTGVLLASVYLLFIVDGRFQSNACLNTPIDISIHGDTLYRSRTINALRFIESNDCEYLLYVWDNAKTVRAGYLGMFAGGQYRHEREVIYLDAFSGRDSSLAGIIVHEACHSFQDKNDMPFLESECDKTKDNFLGAVGAPNPWRPAGENTRDTFPMWKEQRLNEVKG